MEVFSECVIKLYLAGYTGIGHGSMLGGQMQSDFVNHERCIYQCRKLLAGIDKCTFIFLHSFSNFVFPKKVEYAILLHEV